MKTSFLNTLAAGILTSLCLSGMPESASAQFFNNTEVTSPINRVPDTRYNDAYSLQTPRQWQDRGRMTQPMDRRYIRTNATDGILPQDDYRSRQGRCADGECKHNRGERAMEDGTTSYRSRRSRSNGLVEGRSYQSRRAMTTGSDMLNPDAIDSASGRPMERSYQGRHTHANGAHHRGQGRCGDCVNGQCACPDGQCTCPAGQCNYRDGQLGSRSLDPRNAPASYDNFNLTRRNLSPQYLPTRSPYLN